MKLKPFKRIPALIAFCVILLVCLLRYFQWDFTEHLERMTYDMRVRQALKFTPDVAPNLGFVAIDEPSVTYVRTNKAEGFGYGLYWPRNVYGRLVEELAAQGAKAIAFDVIFGELRPDLPTVKTPDGFEMSSDMFFAMQMRGAGNVILARTDDLSIPDLFRDNAHATADIYTERDAPEGIVRRVKAFRVYRHWHSLFQQLEARVPGLDTKKAVVERDRIVFPLPNQESFVYRLDRAGNFYLGNLTDTNKIPAGLPHWARPFSDERVWHMGVVLAAQELKLDLDNAEIDLPNGRITLRGPKGIERVIPVNPDASFYIDWCMPPDQPQLTRQSLKAVMEQNVERAQGRTNKLSNVWRGKLAVVGSAAVGNDLIDRGATPLRGDTLLVSKHWNVANSIITGRFVRRSPLAVDLALIVLLGALAAILTWELSALMGLTMLFLTGTGYLLLAVALYVKTRYWLPLVLPFGGGALVTYVFLVTWRVVFEQSEQRRVKSVFSKMVSPKIVHELLAAETLSLGGARREITVYFADVRGFTEFTDKSQEMVADYVRRHNLTGSAAEACFDLQARETLSTVNLYLGLIADIIKKQDGTLDKFIGDCVMAFWGAPTPNPRHAVSCVRAAIEAQRAIYQLNRQRALENRRRAAEHDARVAAGLPPEPPMPILTMGSGINTGVATAGLMGSAAGDQLNYTLFGREVNLASRLEGASGRGHIFVSETTYQHLRRDDPALAATCIGLAPIPVKGFRHPVPVYEVPWLPEGAMPFEVEFATAASGDTTSFTSFIQRPQ